MEEDSIGGSEAVQQCGQPIKRSFKASAPLNLINCYILNNIPLSAPPPNLTAPRNSELILIYFTRLKPLTAGTIIWTRRNYTI